MTVKELIVFLIGCDADSNVVLEDDEEFTDEYGKVSGTCYQIEKVIKHGRSVSLHFDNRQHFMREQEPKTGHWIPTNDISKWGYKCSECEGIDDTDLGHFCKWCGAKMESEG